MATASLGRLTLDLVARTGNFVNGMSKAERATDAWRKKTQRNATLVKAALAGVATAAALWLKSSVNDALEAADNMSKLADRIGTATENIAGLQLAFELGGAGADVMEKSLVKLSDQAAKGNKAFEALGINVKDSAGNLKDARDLFAEVADKFAATKDSAQKTAMAVQLFGRSGAEIIPILNSGARGLAEMDEKARKLGLTIDTETGKAVEAFNDQMALWKKKSEGIKMQIMSGMLPALTALSNAFLETKDGSDTARSAGAALGSLLVNLASIAAKVAAAFKILAVEIANAINKAGLWLNKNKEQNDIVAQGREEYKKARKIIEDTRKARLAAGEDLKTVNMQTRLQMKALGDVDTFTAKKLEESNQRYTSAMEAASNSRLQGITEIIDGLEKTQKALDGAKNPTETIKSDRNSIPEMPEIPASGGKGGGKSKKSGGKSGVDTFAQQMSQMQSEAAKLSEQLQSMKVNDGLVSSYTKLSDLQRDILFNADKYKGVSTEQLEKLKAQAKAIDEINQKITVQHFVSDTKKRLEDMAFENTLIGKAADEIDRLRFARELDNAVKEKSIGLSAKHREEMEKAAEAAKREYQRQQEQAKEAAEKAQTWQEGLAQGLKEWMAQAKNLGEATKDFVKNGLDGISNSISELLTTGKTNFKEFAVSMLKQLAQMMVKLAMANALMSMLKGLGGGGGGGFWATLLQSVSSGGGGGFAFANGGAFNHGVQFFASGGIFDSPTAFKHAKGLGVLGEAGPEAIMPLTRGKDGKLGVAASGSMGGGKDVTINHTVIVYQDGTETQTDAPEQYKQLMDAHFDKKIADALRNGGTLDQAIKAKAGRK